jgi:hypothetical protein
VQHAHQNGRSLRHPPPTIIFVENFHNNIFWKQCNLTLELQSILNAIFFVITLEIHTPFCYQGLRFNAKSPKKPKIWTFWTQKPNNKLVSA